MGATQEAVATPAVLAADGNADGQLTFGDLGPWLHDAFFLPGDWLLWTIASYLPGLARFLEVGAADYGGVLSGFLSAVGWLALLLGGSIAYHSLRGADRALTRGVAGLWAETLRRGRIAVAMLGARSRARKTTPSEALEFVEALQLNADELRALKLHTELQPGDVLGLDEIAVALGSGARAAQRVLARLEQLGLVEAAHGASRGKRSYTLTRSGRAFLLFRQLAPRS